MFYLNFGLKSRPRGVFGVPDSKSDISFVHLILPGLVIDPVMVRTGPFCPQNIFSSECGHVTYQTNHLIELTPNLPKIMGVGVTLGAFVSNYGKCHILSFAHTEIVTGTIGTYTHKNFIFYTNRPIKTILYNRIKLANQIQSYVFFPIHVTVIRSISKLT